MQLFVPAKLGVEMDALTAVSTAPLTVHNVCEAVDKTMLIYTLPGSVKAVREYTEEILRTLPHSLLMLHGINSH